MNTTAPRRRVTAPLLAALALVLAASGCSSVGDSLGLSAERATADAPPAVATEEPVPYESQFTTDGTYQSHKKIEGVDFVYTLYPTKATPRTHEWFPGGEKFFSYTLQAYDLRRDLRDDFETKREVYAGRITVKSSTVRRGGGATERPYELDAQARDVTFDPEPLGNRYGMLITSPKGALEMRNQAIAPVAEDTTGIDLVLATVVWIETAPGSGEYRKKVVRETVPIALFPSAQPTVAEPIPFTSN